MTLVVLPSTHNPASRSAEHYSSQTSPQHDLQPNRPFAESVRLLMVNSVVAP